MEHDETCRRQDMELITLKATATSTDEDLREIIKKFNEFIRDRSDDRVTWKGMAKDIETVKADIAVIKTTLRNDVAPMKDVESMRRWWTLIAGAVILAFVSAVWAFVLRGGLAAVTPVVTK